jgi:2'-5' RNA ligase
MQSLFPRGRLEKQTAVFEDFWRRFSAQVRNGEGKADFPSDSELKAQHHTTVVRLPKELAQRCAKLIQPLKEQFPDHYYYPAQDLHFTLLNLDALINANTAPAVDFAFIADSLKQTIAGLPPLTLQLKGLGLFPTTIFAQVYDTSGTIELYRTAIRETVRKSLSLDIDVEPLVKDIAFVNLGRFKHTPEKEIVETVEAHRRTEIGTFTVDAIELVTTDRLLSKPNTTLNGAIRLEAR